MSIVLQQGHLGTLRINVSINFVIDANDVEDDILLLIGKVGIAVLKSIGKCSSLPKYYVSVHIFLHYFIGPTSRYNRCSLLNQVFLKSKASLIVLMNL